MPRTGTVITALAAVALLGLAVTGGGVIRSPGAAAAAGQPGG